MQFKNYDDVVHNGSVHQSNRVREICCDIGADFSISGVRVSDERLEHMAFQEFMLEVKQQNDESE